ncbi:hypothetical protein VTJ04DRAFT_8810 [Mycothermus thermophilus]|uniref:uncharacterized protein n=1 Tax=Humicola insolens TaxID=85995 RepID=UPI003744085E
MFKTNPKASFGTSRPPPPEDESDDDAISLTDTIEDNDPDKEYVVEGILAEREFEGEIYYLVEWEDFPLHQCTWEANISPDLKEEWEKEKARIAAGEKEPFDVQKFYDAYDKAQAAKKERRRLRNEKRKRLGLPEVDYSKEEEAEDSDDDEPAPKVVEISSDEEAVEVPGAKVVDEEPARPRVPASDVRRSPRRRSSSGGAQVAPGPASPQAPKEARAQRKGSVEKTTPSQPDARPSAKPRQNIQDPNVGVTGYQGTARPSKPFLVATQPRSSASMSAAGPASTTTKKKALTAKKSTATGNIFVSGKKTKPRPGLKDIMGDPTREPKLFGKHRYRRLAELKSRNKEDIAPDASKIPLIELRTGQVIGPRVSGTLVHSPTQMSPREEAASPFTAVAPATPTTVEEPQEAPQRATQEVPTSPTNISSANEEALSQPGPPKKKRKSVRFAEKEDDQLFVPPADPMDMDSATLNSPSVIPSPALPSPTLRTETQSVDKTLTVGKSSLVATFSAVPRDSSGSLAWVADFLSAESLVFAHTCLQETAKEKFGRPQFPLETYLASGTVLPKGSEVGLEKIAEYLACGLSAAVCGRNGYTVLVYPTKSQEEWGWIPRGRAAPDSPRAPLGYLVFSLTDWIYMLPPVSGSLASPVEPDENTRKSKEGPVPPQEQLMKRLFSFDYNKLLPAAARSTAEHTFFLAFPPSKSDRMEAVCHWLRSNNAECKIFTSLHPGGWGAFQSRTERVPGVAIIHEALAWNIRSFPGLAQKLISSLDEYWFFSELSYGLPLYPSISIPDSPVPPGELQLTRLFPHRTAILLTPSFLVSQPERALEFFKWYATWIGRFHVRLVTAHNIHEYLAELADEKYEARRNLWNPPENDQFEVAARLEGLGRDDCRARYEAAELAGEFHVAHMIKAGPLAHDEDSSPLVYADPSIDPNDEQSLVNWFGWWSTLRADQFRKFYVIGSDLSVLHGQRGERTIRVPRYTRVTLNDPDAVLEVVRDEMMAPVTEVQGNGPELQPNPEDDRIVRFYKGPWAFRSRLVTREDSEAFTHVLEGIIPPQYRKQWTCYKFPVSWLDFSMAGHFGDFGARFVRYKDWFDFAHPFATKGLFNTYVGFFYTISTEWDADDLTEGAVPQRYPWLALYRPVNPHLKPYSRCELIIWDPAARVRYPNGKAPAEKDLIFMQRELIQYVRENGEAKNNGTWLDQVWYGGWDWPDECDEQYPIDLTLQFLRCILGDIRNFIPAPEHVMESKGFKRVLLDPDSDAHQQPAFGGRAPDAGNDGDVPMDIDTPSPGDDQDSVNWDDVHELRIIFHPPRGKTVANGAMARSKCSNLLYEEARLARARDLSATHMKFRFPPTMEWYAQQKAEGRGYEHIYVETWEDVFKRLKIGEANKAEGQAADNKDGARKGEESTTSG